MKTYAERIDEERVRNWVKFTKKKDIKFKLSKKHKHYIDKPYIVPNTIDETIMDEEEIKLLIQKKLNEKFIQHLTVTSIIDVPLMFRNCKYYSDGIIYVAAIEPLFQPTVIGLSEDVYKIEHIKNIKHLRFCDIGTYSKQYSISNEYVYQSGKQQILSAKHLFPSFQTYMKLVINSYYGMSTDNKNDYTPISVIINNSWKVHAMVFTSKSSVLDMIHNMYNAGLVTFESYANVKFTQLDIQKLVENGILFSNYCHDILSDALVYDKPSKFRQELFKYLEDQNTIDYYKFMADKINKPTRAGLSNNFYISLALGQNVRYRDNVMEFIYQYKIQLLSAMNKYGDITDNTEDIKL